jgi:hypothetical protein
MRMPGLKPDGFLSLLSVRLKPDALPQDYDGEFSAG